MSSITHKHIEHRAGIMPSNTHKHIKLGYSSPQTEFKGILFPTFITEERLQQAEEDVAKPQDIWVATYPKAGIVLLN